MATTTVSDFVIWTKHIHGDVKLASLLAQLGAGEVLKLRVNGVEGNWRKMDDGKDGRPTPGLRPLGNTQQFWRALYRSRRGEVIEVELVEGPVSQGDRGVTAAASPLVRTDADREAAVAAFMSLAGQGWRSDAPYGSRDELHER